MMSGVFFLFLAGLVALGFLVLIVRRKRMPAILRALLIIGAAAIVVYVGWTLVVVLSAAPATPR